MKACMDQRRIVSGTTGAMDMALVILLLGLRVLSPAGFMPAFDHGEVTIVACADAMPFGMTPGPMHHQHDKRHPSPCPYAAASGLSAIGEEAAFPFDALALGAALLLGRTFLFMERHRPRERPPLRGPPLPA